MADVAYAIGGAAALAALAAVLVDLTYAVALLSLAMNCQL